MATIFTSYGGFSAALGLIEEQSSDGDGGCDVDQEALFLWSFLLSLLLL